MVKYHGVSGFAERDIAPFLINRHALISFEKPKHLGVVSTLAQGFIIDNGAFTKWRKGSGRVDTSAYIDFLYNYYRHPSFHWCVIPDVIGAKDESINVKEIQDFPRDIRAVPVWHMGDSLEMLEWIVKSFDRMCLASNGIRNGIDYYKCIGSLIWWERINEAMCIICDKNNQPKIPVHGLKMLNPKIFTKIPLASGDSSNADRNKNQLERFDCQYPLLTNYQRALAIAMNCETYHSPAYWSYTDVIREKEKSKKVFYGNPNTDKRETVFTHL